MNIYLKTALQHIKRAFPFLPEPDLPSDERYLGIVTHPGFHTTGDIDIAAAYAAGRILSNFTKEDDDGKAFVTDYPVIAVVDTAGAEKFTDYDAENMALEGLKAALDNMQADGLTADSPNDEIRDVAYGQLEFYEDQSDLGAYSTPMDFFSERVFMHFTNPLNEDVVNHPDFPDAVRAYYATGRWPHAQLLMEMTNQYRYIVPIDTLVGVYYVSPVASISEDFESNAEEIAKDWAGFDVPWLDDLYSGSYAPEYTLVMGEDTGDMEYHGTTYHRLQQAFPDINFPEPPSPPYRG